MQKLLSLICLTGCCFFTTAGQGQDDRGLDQPAIDRWMQQYSRVASEYEISEANDPDSAARFKVTKAPLLTYVYPHQFRKSHGAFFVWTVKTRPQVIGCMWSQLEANGQRTLVHELHSLSEKPLLATWQQAVQWTPTASGIQFKPVPRSSRPMTDVRLWKIQASRLAQQFSGTTHREQDRKLDLQRKPLFVYGENPGAPGSGALFGLFDDRDAEIFLWLEVQEFEGTNTWMYAPLPFSDARLTLECEGLTVWSDGPRSFTDSTSPYFSARPRQYEADLPDPDESESPPAR